MIFGGIGGLAVLFRIIFGFLPKGDEFGECSKVYLPKGEEARNPTDDTGFLDPFWDFTSTYYIDD